MSKMSPIVADFLKTKQPDAETVEILFCMLSEKGQNEFLDNLKEFLSREDWEKIVVHLKAFQLAMIDSPKKAAIKEALLTAFEDKLYNQKVGINA